MISALYFLLCTVSIFGFHKFEVGYTALSATIQKENMFYGHLEHVRRACHRIVEDDDAKTEIRRIAARVLRENIVDDEDVRLGDTILCHGGGDKTIIMQMIILPDHINHQRVKCIFSQLKSSLVQSQNAGHVLVHWEL